MSNFSAVLQEYQLGIRDLHDVETQIEQELVQDLVPAEDLVRKLDEQHAIRQFDPEQRRTIERCIWTIETKRRTEFERSMDSRVDVDAEAESVDEPKSDQAADPAAKSGAEDLPTPADEATVIATPKTASEGTVLNNRYRLEKLIGRGGMSEVYLAVDQFDEEYESRNPHIAVKVMNVDTRNQKDAVLAMQREVEKSKRLTHENILRVHHFDRDGELAFMTMELLKGESLLQRLSKSTRGGLPASEAEEILLQVAAALQHAHEKGIVHADLKPGNVFLNEQERVKVIDFGIARALRNPADPDGTKTVFDPRRLGALTPAYASPEMLEGAEPDARDDIYSLGCLAYELYTGKHPFARAPATDARDSGYEITRPKQIPKEKWEAIRHALAFDQARRTPSAAAFIDEFSAAGKIPTVQLAAGAAGLVLVIALATMLVDWGGGEAADESADALAESTGVFKDCEFCPELVTIPSGSAVIGSTSAVATAFEAPIHRVYIGEPFALGRAEVTVAQYQKFVEETGWESGSCRTFDRGWNPEPAIGWQSPGYPQAADHPVACVSYLDARAYLQWLSTVSGHNYRLPSEAEWEFAARRTAVGNPAVAADELADCRSGNVADQALVGALDGRGGAASINAASCNDGFPFTSPVGAAATNNGELYDLRGNLFEWTEDCWKADYVGAPSDGSAQASSDCGQRVLRGGSWFTAPTEQRVAFRNRAPLDYRSNTFGFRVARALGESIKREH